MFAASFLLLVTAAGATAPALAAPQRDWTRTVVATPAGGFQIGNPRAKVKLIEYASFTCPHCAHFAEKGMPLLLQNYVRRGKVSFELRNFVRDPYDLAAALLSRCARPRQYFPFTHQIFATQKAWIGRFGDLSASESDALNALPQSAKLTRISAIAGFNTLAAKFGVGPARAKACLADEKAMARIAEIRREAISRYTLTGTPSFVINGKKADGVGGWTELEPLLRQAGG